MNSTSLLAAARTFLFVPADRPERYAKALASGADVVIVDLEDAVAPAARPAARAALLAAWPEWPMAALGHLDLQVDLGISCGPDEAEVAPARWAMVRASRRAGLAAPVDGVTTDTRDMAVVESAAAKSLRYGFGAKLCIHPAQVAAVHVAFMPGADELALARRIVQAAEASGGGSCAVDGRMVDAPVITMARRTLARAAATRSTPETS